jgi:hypothetical protein
MTPEEQILLRVKTDKMILDKMQETNTLLKDIKDKEVQDIKMPEMDMSETNSLLQQLVDKEKSSEQISVRLKIV